MAQRERDRREDSWRAAITRYQQSDGHRALLQLATTLVPLGVVFWAMYRLLGISYGWTLLLVPLAAGLLVRTFVLMHDCAHGSFLPSRRLNDVVGFLTGILTLTSFGHWRREHALHHASSGDLDRRGHGDVYTLTVREYDALTRWGKLQYRLMRQPLLLLAFGPLYLLWGQRVPPRGPSVSAKQRASVWAASAAIVALGAAFALLIGVRAVLLIYLPSYYLASVAGVWLFYVQHQFEEAYWQPHDRWDYMTAAVHGSSYFQLPAVLNWFTGSIGLHHVHHLSPKIPNYQLRRCHDETQLFPGVRVITLAQSVATFRLALWDEEHRRLVSFGDAARLRERVPDAVAETVPHVVARTG